MYSGDILHQHIVQLHPFCQQKPIVEHCEKLGIVVEAYTPLVRGQAGKIDHPVIAAIGEKVLSRTIAFTLLNNCHSMGKKAHKSSFAGLSKKDTFLCPSRRSHSELFPTRMCTTLRYRERIWSGSTRLTGALRARRAGILWMRSELVVRRAVWMQTHLLLIVFIGGEAVWRVTYLTSAYSSPGGDVVHVSYNSTSVGDGAMS